MSEYLISALLLLGGAFVLIGSLGINKLPDIYTRLHGPTKATTLGMAAILVAANIYFSLSQPGWHVKEILISVFLFITAPIGSYMLIKVAIHQRLKASEDTQGQDNMPRD